MTAAVTATNNQRIFRQAKADRHQFTILDQRTVKGEELTGKAHSLLIKMLGFADRWRFNIKHLAKVAGYCEKTTLKYINELIEAGYVLREWVRGVNNHCISEVVYLVAETPDCMPILPKVDRSTPQPESNLSTRKVLTSKAFTKKNLPHISKIQSNQNQKTNYYQEQVAEKYICSDFSEFQPELEDFWLDPIPADINGTQELEKEIQASKKAIGEKNIPATCDKIELEEIQKPEPPPPRMANPSPKSTLSAIGASIGHIKQSIQSAMKTATAAPETTKPEQQPKKQIKARLEASEGLEYKNKLAGIGVHLDTVEWIIHQLDPKERFQAVVNAIAWVNENSNWIKDPAAMFVAAIREGRMPNSVRNAELKEIQKAKANQDEGAQFRAWRERAQDAAKLVDHCYGVDDPACYAMAVIAETQKIMPWREAQALLADQLAQFEIERLKQI